MMLLTGVVILLAVLFTCLMAIYFLYFLAVLDHVVCYMCLTPYIPYLFIYIYIYRQTASQPISNIAISRSWNDSLFSQHWYMSPVTWSSNMWMKSLWQAMWSEFYFWRWVSKLKGSQGGEGGGLVLQLLLSFQGFTYLRLKACWRQRSIKLMSTCG